MSESAGPDSGLLPAGVSTLRALHPAKMLMWAGLVVCGRVWQWREAVPDWLWFTLMAAGWLCFRTALRSRASHPASEPTSLPGAYSAAWAVTCGACAYAANLRDLPGAVGLVGMAVLAFFVRHDAALVKFWPTAVAGVALVGTSAGAVAAVLMRAGHGGDALDLARMAAAWLCGLLVAGAVYSLMPKLAPDAFNREADGVATAGAGSEAPGVSTSGAAVWHGRLLVLTAVCIPLGEGLALVALALLAIVVVLRRRHIAWPLLRAHEAPLAIAACLGLWALAGAGAVLSGGEGWLKPSELGRWVPYAAAFLPVLSVGAVPRRWFWAAATGFLASLAVASCVGLLMYGFDLRPGSGALAWLPTPSAQSRVPGSFATVAGGFYFHRLKMAHVLLVGLAAVSARLFSLPQGQARAREAAVWGLFGVTLFLTFARGAWVGLAAMSGVGALLAEARLRRTIVVAAFGIALGVLAMPAQRARLVSMAGADASSIRATVWTQAVAVLREHPFGVGLGNYTPVIGGYYDRLANGREFPRTYPHNMVLAAWAETGPVGLAGYVGAWVFFLQACLRPHRRGARADARKTAAAAGLAAATALWVVGITHDVLFHNAVALAFCGMAGWVMACIVASPDARNP